MLTAGTLTNGVEVATGQVKFPVVLARRRGRNGLDLTISATYSSDSLRTATHDNVTAPTGVLGLGWTLELDRIAAVQGQSAAPADCIYVLHRGSRQSRLVRIGTNSDGTWSFAAENYVFWRISYDPGAELWRTVDEDGTVRLFGGASAGADAVAWAVAWGGWIGASANLFDQRRVAVGWALASISDRFGDQVSCRYAQVPVAVGSPGGLTFTQASYLAEVIGVDGSRAVLTYAAKDAAEYQNPHTNPPPPNAWQDPVATRYLAALELYTPSGVLLDHVAFGYANSPLGSGSLTKRLLVSIARSNGDGTAREPATRFSYWGQSLNDGVNATQVYNSTNGALYGALSSVTLAAGGSVAYGYSSTSIGYGSRSLALVVPAGGTQPRLAFHQDTVLVTWLDAGNAVHLQAYVYTGRWLMTEIAKVTLDSAADYAGVQTALGDGCAAMFANKKVFVVARDITNPGGWLLPAQSYLPTLATNEAATLVAGRGFAALLGLTGGSLYRYRFAAAAWTADPALAVGAAGNTFAVAAADAMLAAVAAPASGGATAVTLLQRATDGTWIEKHAALDLSGLAGTLTLGLGGGFGVVGATSAQAGGQRAQYGVLWWNADLSSVNGQGWLLQRQPTGMPVPVPVIAGSSVAIGRRLYRFDGVAWTFFDAGSVAYPGAGAPVSSALGADMFAQLFTGTTVGQQVAALLTYDPNLDVWVTPPNLDVAAAAPLVALAPRGDGPSNSYALVGNQLWYRAPSGSWTSLLTLPALTAADLATAQLVGNDYLVVQKGTGTVGVATLVYLLANAAASAPITLTGSQVAVPGQPGSALVGQRAFAAYSGTWGSTAALTLYRPVCGDVQGAQTGYAVATVTANNGTADVSGVNGTFKTQYLPQSTGAVIGIDGYTPHFNKMVVVPGGLGAGNTQPNGNVTYGIYNGLATSETPAVAYPTSPVTNAGTSTCIVAGLTYSRQVNDKAAATVVSSISSWSVTTVTLGQWGQGAYARIIQSDVTENGVKQTSLAQYASETGLAKQISAQVYNAAGTIDTFTTLLTYWWEIYDPGRSRNMLTPVVQSQQQSTPAGLSTSTIGTSITTWRSNWGSGDGRWAPDRNFAALTASPPAFNSWLPTDPPPASGYRMTGRVLQRTGAGLPLQTQTTDPFNTPSLVTYDTSGSYPVATAGNVAPGTDMLSWFGCEPYESSGLWASSDPALSIWSYLTHADSHTGTQCLALPANTAANGPLLVVQPGDQTRRYLFSCWARAANGFAPASGVAQWMIQPFDPATGANAGVPIPLVLTPAQGNGPTAVGGWSYFQLTIDLPALVAASGKSALGLSVLATNANTARLCYVDELRFMPLDCLFSVNVYDPDRFWLTAVIDSTGQSRQVRYDAGGSVYLRLGPNDRVDAIAAKSYSRDITNADAFSATFPNTALTLRTAADSRYYDFHDGNIADWSCSDANWSITDGQLVHAGAGTGAVGATATLTVCAYTYLGARIEVVSPKPAGTASISLGNGDIYMQWSQTGASGVWQLVQVAGTTATVLQTNSQVAWGRQWTFCAVDGFVLCFVDAVQIFAYQYTMPSPVPAGYGKVWIGTTAAAAFDNLVVVNTPQIGLSFADGLGTSLQQLDVQGFVPARGPVYPSQTVASGDGVLLDTLGRPATRRLGMAVPVQLAALPTPNHCALIEATPSTYLYSPSGTELTLADYMAGQGGYTYEETTYETSPRSLPTQLVLPRPNDAANPAANYTVTLAYGGVQTVGGASGTVNKYLTVAASRVLSSTGGVTQSVTEVTTRDGLGRPLMTQQGLSTGTQLQTVYRYDNAGRLATIEQPNFFAAPSGTNPAAWVETRTYDFLGCPIARTTTDSGTTRYMYDSALRLRFVLDADGAAAQPVRIMYVKYDALNRQTETGYIQDASYAWNAALQQKADVVQFPIIVTNPSQPNQAAGAWRKRFSYDSDGSLYTRYFVGRPWQAAINQNASAASPDIETYGYDAFGNTVTKTVVMPGISTGAGWSMAYSYNGQDQVAAINYPRLDPNATPPFITYTYDRLGRLAAVGDAVDPGGIIDPSNPPPDPAMRYALYGYSSFGQVANARYNNGTVSNVGAPVSRTFNYDIAQRLTGIADPYFVETLQYTGDGLTTSYYNGQIAAASSTYVPSAKWPQPPNAFTQQFTYDGNGRLIAAANSLGSAMSLTFPASGYDANGNIVSAQRGATTLTYSYAGSGDTAKNEVHSVAQAVSNSVDFTRLPLSTTTAGGWTWGANNAGPSGSGLIAASPPGEQALVLAGGSLGHYEVLQLATYLAPNANCTLSFKAATGTGYGQAIGAATWYVVLYAESGPSTALPLKSIAASASFVADSIAVNLPQIIQSCGGGLPIVAASVELRNLGRNANGSTGPSIYLASVGIAGTASGQAYGYDPDGRTIAAPDQNLSQLVYDPTSGLTTRISISGTPPTTLTLAYGADNRRTRATLSNSSATLASAISLTGPDGALLATSTTAGGNTSIRYFANDSAGPFGLLSGQDYQLLLRDHLGSTRVAVDAKSGRALEALDYLPFGQTQRRSGTPVTALGFTGQRFDPATALYNYNARLYDPTLGRFLSADPAREYPSPYVYVGNDPFNRTDPTGTISVLGIRFAIGSVRTLVWTAIGAGVGAGAGALWDYLAGPPQQGPSRTIQGAEYGAMVGAGIGVVGGLAEIVYGYFRGGPGPYPVVLYNPEQETTVGGIGFLTFDSGRSGAEVIAEAAGIPRRLYDTYLIPFGQLNIAQTIVNLAQFSGRLIVVAHGNEGWLEMSNGNYETAADLAGLLNAAAWGLVDSIDFSVCFAAAGAIGADNLARDLRTALAALLPVGAVIRAAEVGMGPIGSGSALGVLSIYGNPVQVFFHHLLFGFVFRGDVIGNAGLPGSGWQRF